MHNAATIPAGSFIPYDPPRVGTFVRPQSGNGEPVGAWYILHNLPANSTWRVRYLRPDKSEFRDSGTQPYGNTSPYRNQNWWVWYGLALDMSGTWSFELSINGQVQVVAPFLVVDGGTAPTNHPPNPVTAIFDPPAPGTNDVVFCRLTVPLLEDPDYDLMRYRYQWRVNGVAIREVTSAAHADAVPRGVALPGDILSCTATPFDGALYGPPVTVQVAMPRPGVQLSIQLLAGPEIILSWPASATNYVLQSARTISGNSWQTHTDIASLVGGQWQVTNSVSGSLFYRLMQQ